MYIRTRNAIVVKKSDLINVIVDITFTNKNANNIVTVNLKTKKVKEMKSEEIPYFMESNEMFLVILENSILWENVQIFIDRNSKNEKTFSIESIWHK